MSAEPLIEAVGLTKHFPVTAGAFNRAVGHVPAADDVSPATHGGETPGLAGEPGWGKPPLGPPLIRLPEPTAGEVRFRGLPLTGLGKRDMRRLRGEVAMVFQDPYASLDPRQTVGDIIGEALAIQTDVPRHARAARIRELLGMVGLAPAHADRYPHEFSGGQRQRVGIARALAVEPSFIVCDEPISALDVSIQAQIINLLMRLQEELRLTYLF